MLQIFGSFIPYWAATTAAAKGIPDSTIQTLGRWKSDSFKHYIRMPHSELYSINISSIDTLRTVSEYLLQVSFIQCIDAITV